MQKSSIGIVLFAIGLILMLYEGYWLYSGYYLQNNLNVLCTISNSANSSIHNFQCRYGAITIDGNTPLNSVPNQLLSASFAEINVSHQWIFGLGLILLLIGLILRIRK